MPTNAPVRLVRDEGPLEPMRFRFTVRLLERIAPADKQVWVYDTGAPGLAMLTTPAGSKTFYLARRMEGRYRRVKIGPFPGVTIEQARRQVAKLTGQIASGQNPAEARRTARAATTFRDLFDYYIEHHARPHKRTWREDQAKYDNYLKRWASRRLDQIKRQDVITLHGRIGREYPIAANRLLALLSKVYNVAADIGYDGPNPARGVKRYAERQRGRFIDASEMPAFLAALETETNQTLIDYFRLLLFTGQRRGNVASMRWEEVDLRRAVWTIPGAKFKTGQAVEIPLVPQAVELLKARQKDADGSEWVFPNRRRNPKCPHLREPGDALKRICERAGIAGVRPHDLRRTVASWATMQGVPYPIVARMVGHRVQGVTGVYARFDLSAVRDGFERTVNAMLASVGRGECRKRAER